MLTVFAGRRSGIWLVAASLLVSAAGCGGSSTAGPRTTSASAIPATLCNSASPSQPLPDMDIQAAGLSEACLLTRFDLKATEGGHTITLVGAYADPVRIVLIVSMSPDDQGTPMPPTLTEDVSGILNSGGGSGPVDPHVPGSGYILYFSGGFQAMAGRIAHIKAHFALGIQGPPGLNDPGVNIAFNLRVFTATSLQAPPPFKLGSWPVTITALEVTPAVIHVQVLIAGANLEDIPEGPNEPMTLVDQSGKPLRPVSGSGSRDADGARLDMQWMRPLDAGTYELRLDVNGATKAVPLKVPAMTVS